MVLLPSKIDTLCTVLPCLPSQSELIALKFKRKLSYKSHYMYDYVTPQNILDALRYLKTNNPYYKNVNINNSWLTQALEDNEDVLCSLIENPPVTNNSDQVNDPSPIETSSSLEENPLLAIIPMSLTLVHLLLLFLLLLYHYLITLLGELLLY